MRIEVREFLGEVDVTLQLETNDQPIQSFVKMVSACDAFAKSVAKQSNGLVTPQDVMSTLAEVLMAGGVEALKGGVLNG